MTEYDPEKQNFFYLIIKQLDDELNLIIPAFLDKLETIKQLTTELNESLEDSDDFPEKYYYLLMSIKESIKKTNYHDYQFNNFPVTQIFITHLFDSFRSKQILKLEGLLINSNADSNTKAHTIIQQISRDVNGRIRLLEQRLSMIKEDLPVTMSRGQDGIHYYEQEIASRRLPFRIKSITLQKQQTIAQLLTLCIELKHCSEKQTFRKKLNKLYSSIKKISYVLNYWGGDLIKSNANQQKVPRHIKKMLELYEAHINDDDSYEHYQLILEKIQEFAQQALADRSFQLRFFKVRDISTQQIYQAIAAGYKIQDFTLSFSTGSF